MYYFENKENQVKLYTELEEWLDTPFKHRCMVKGKGVDCIHLVAGVFINLLAISSSLKYPEYDRDWHMHNDRELLYEYIHANVNVEDIQINQIPQNGDILLYKFGKAHSHAGIYFNNEVYHSMTNKKVTKMVFKDAMWYRRLGYILRLKK